MATTNREAPVVVGIDAAGINSGGGLAHLVELLAAAQPGRSGVERIVIWAGPECAKALPRRPFIELECPKELASGQFRRAAWQRFSLPNRARETGCGVLFVPGGTSVCTFRPIVGMSQNLLPFQSAEARRYGFSWMHLRLMILRATQGSLARRADGYVFLTEFSRRCVLDAVGMERPSTVIAHGIADRFRQDPSPPARVEDCGSQRPFRIVYVSIVDVYKHQWILAQAVARLGSMGLPVRLDLVGPAYGPALRRLTAAVKTVDPEGKWVRYLGPVPNATLPELYSTTDLVAFASSCENLPIILLEAMASGAPIACSNRGPMPEVLGPNGHYFDPESVDSTASCIERMVRSPELRQCAAAESLSRSKPYTWERCADETLAYLAEVARASESR